MTKWKRTIVNDNDDKAVHNQTGDLRQKNGDDVAIKGRPCTRITNQSIQCYNQSEK
ncbi:hypothetical protein RvY_17918 [Ramazzottius varieornatus]|uniref:Uncharacterized protein n=1 Tax=Ramazzottius varieornatus TaxID=947166 RepID=A0A1D1W3W8_RAMVA|nr:hypothetical protein RvY_17918 [Ramazzottius varieornatus]